jgi:peptide/nickel transport system substrate-binding protein
MNSKDDSTGLTRRDFLYWSGVGMGGIALVGIPELTHGAEEKPKYGGRIRVGFRYAAMGLDVHRNQDFADYLSYILMYEALTEQGKLPQVETYPMLAKSWEISADGKEYIFSLREGVKFHHGKELDSGDVKYSIERIINPATRSPRAFAFQWIESVSTLDKYHVKIRLKEPFAPLLTTLTARNCPIIPAGWEPTGMKPAPGTGPFVFKSFVPNETLEVTRFDKYWEMDEKTGDRLPYLDGIYIQKIIDETVRLTGLRAGDLDVIDTPPLNIAAKAILERQMPGMFMDYEPVGSNWIYFNLSKPPFNNKKVRQAISYALDRKEFLKAAFWGLGETTNNQPFLNRSRFYIPIQEREVDLAKAKQLMVEAGYPNGFKTEFFQFSLTQPVKCAEVAIGQLQKIGIEATMKVIDRAPYFAAMRKGDFSLSFTVGDEPFDWDDAYYMYLHSGEIGKNNWSRYSNKELDALLEKGRTTWRWEDRVPIYKQVLEILKEDLPVLYTTKSVTTYGFRDYLKGYRKGFSARMAWHGGGVKYWWLDK